MLLYPQFAALFFLLVPVVFILYRNYKLGRKEFHRIRGSGPARSLYDAFTVKWVFVSLSFILALIFIILSLMGIRSEKKNIREIPSKLDVVFTLDISRSMMAEDIIPNRLSRSFTLINNITGRFKTARFGIVVFKGEGLVLVPVTEDQEAISQAVDIISPSLFTSSSSNLASGLETALKAFPDGEDRRKVIIFISDGESHSGNITEMASLAKDRDIVIDVFAVGTREGGKIPLGDGTYLKDRNGNDVVSVLNPALLGKIAEISDGNYCTVDSLNSMNEQVSCLSISGEQEKIRYDQEGSYRLFLLLAVVLFVLSLLIKVLPWRGTY